MKALCLSLMPWVCCLSANAAYHMFVKGGFASDSKDMSLGFYVPDLAGFNPQHVRVGLGLDLFIPELKPFEQYDQDFIMDGDHTSRGFGLQATGAYALNESIVLTLKVGRSRQVHKSAFGREEYSVVPLWSKTEIKRNHYYGGVEWGILQSKFQPYIALGASYIYQSAYEDILEDEFVEGSRMLSWLRRFPETERYGVIGGLGFRYLIFGHLSAGIEINSGYMRTVSKGRMKTKPDYDDDYIELELLEIDETGCRKPQMFLRFQYWF